jgi:hypothetical protein
MFFETVLTSALNGVRSCGATSSRRSLSTMNQVIPINGIRNSDWASANERADIRLGAAVRHIIAAANANAAQRLGEPVGELSSGSRV